MNFSDIYKKGLETVKILAKKLIYIDDLWTVFWTKKEKRSHKS